MGIFKREKRDGTMNEEKVDDLLLQALLKGGTVDRTTALSLPVIAGCVDLICNTFAMIPFKLYKETVKDGKRSTEEVVDNRVRLINEDTTDTLDGFQFKKAICEDYLMGKGGYAYIKKIGNKFVGVFYVEDSKITIQKNTDAIYKSFSIMVDGKTFKNHEFLKLLRNTKDGASGKGLTDEISQALQTASRRLQYEYELTATGGSRKGFLKSQKHLDEKSLKALKRAWEEYYAGNANTVVLNDGIDFQEASNTSQQNEMSEKTRTFADEIREIFHLNANFDDFIKNAIMPIATAFATALNRDFLLEKEKAEYYFAPDTKELLKGSLRERYEAYRIAITTGFKTRNEVRYMEDDDALDGLDVISLGLGDVLLNTNDGTIYTPNTNTVAKMGANGTQTAELAPNNDVLGEGNTNTAQQTQNEAESKI